MAKPTVQELGIDPDAQTWLSSGENSPIEIAFVGMRGAGREGGDAPPGVGEWVLMRMAGEPGGRVLVYDRFEWECFLDGVKNGEFDDATE